MAIYRTLLVACATLFIAGMTSAAFACCDMGYAAPVAYAPPVYAGGCGGCGGVVVPYAQPVAPVASWGMGCGGCGAPVMYGCGGCGGYGVYGELTPVAPAPIYVVNQGPDFSGPGLMVPYHTYSPIAAYAPETPTPYVAGPDVGYGVGGYGAGYYPRHYHHHYGYGYGYHRHYAYGERGYMRSHHGYWHYHHSYPYRPLGVRG
jgi:hypothetical protein